MLVLLTLFGALPIYRRVADASPHGQGSISMLEELLPRWKGKAFVLCLLGFAATDFVITITLSAADATAHIIENPFVPHVARPSDRRDAAAARALGAIFLQGFQRGDRPRGRASSASTSCSTSSSSARRCIDVVAASRAVRRRGDARCSQQHGNPLMMLGVALLLFPKLALGLSGFETGVAVMPLVKGDPATRTEHPHGRIRNTKKLLSDGGADHERAADRQQHRDDAADPAGGVRRPAAPAYGRALAFLAHQHLGEVFGTVYDLSTIAILWFAGASAMAGLLNLVPRYLPRYGMAPEWAKATRPLVLLFTAITFLVTILFNADVDAQGGAYATGVLVLMSSAAVAVTLHARRQRARWLGFVADHARLRLHDASLNIYRAAGGHQDRVVVHRRRSSCTSLISRVLRSTELRVHGVEPDDAGAAVHPRRGAARPVRIIANRPGRRAAARSTSTSCARRASRTTCRRTSAVLFLEVRPGDASEFSERAEGAAASTSAATACCAATSPAIPNAIAALLLYIRDETGQIPHAYFGWTEGNPIAYLLKFLAFGEGDTAPVTREVLRQTESNPLRRPRIHVG